MNEFLNDLFVGIKGKKDMERKYRLVSSNYWRWHIKWNIFMAVLLSIPAVGIIAGDSNDGLRIALVILGYLCIFALLAKVTYDTDRWDRCTKCGSQYIDESKHCSSCGIIRKGNTIDGITWRLKREQKSEGKD